MGSLPLTPSWETLASTKRQAILDLIPVRWQLPQPIPEPAAQKDVTGAYVHQFLEDWEIEITEADAVAIVERTTSGAWSAVKVTEAFCHRAALAHQLTHCLHEIFFTAALADAAALDAHFAAHGPIGPLHGLPISFKDQFHIPGVETTMGYVGWIGTFEGRTGTGKERVAESELVREVRAAGAIVFCKTSLPHTVMSIETWNHIVGYTLNPHNRLMTCGGSSGGEGALLAMKGSPLGVGTDIGGSIRVPAAYNGLYGIRPSFGRMSYLGAANSMPGQNTVKSVCGPLAASARSLRLMFQSTLAQQPWTQDPACVDMPWREELAKLPAGETLAFAMYGSDGEVRLTPPVKRALEETKRAIKALGHEVLEWNPPSHARAMKLAVEAYTADGGLEVWQQLNLSGESLNWRTQAFYGKTGPSAPKTADHLAATYLAQRAYQKEYMDYWNSTAKLTKSGRPVDAVFGPVAPFAAIENGKTQTMSYAPFVNVLDYTAVVFPVSKVDEKVDVKDAEYEPLNETDRLIWEEYDSAVSHGTPVGLQLVGRRFQEEKMLALAEMLGDALATPGKGA